MSTGTVRLPVAAGSFYPSGRAGLEAAVDSLLAGVSAGGDPAPKALIVPHAGYVYSGPVAASAYARLVGDRRRRVLLIGPSHFTRLRGLAASGAATWRTPLGDVPLAPVPPGVAVGESAHLQEHALEVQVPFLQRVLGDGLQILPLAVGDGDEQATADQLEPFWQDPGVLVVCSTDLSHYLEAATARAVDLRTASAVEALDIDAIGPYDACGVWALRQLLVLARRHRARVRLLDLRNSGETAGDRDRVVGYGAFAVSGGMAGGVPGAEPG